MNHLAWGIALGFACMASAHGASVSFEVGSMQDKPDSDAGDGVCHGADLPETGAADSCTLRAAVMEANVLSLIHPADTFLIRVPGGIYQLSGRSVDQQDEDVDLVGAYGDLDILATRLTVRGTRPDGSIFPPAQERPEIRGIDITIGGVRRTSSIFDIHQRDVPGRGVQLFDLVLKDGYARYSTAPGGAINCVETPLSIGRTLITNSTSHYEAAAVTLSGCDTSLSLVSIENTVSRFATQPVVWLRPHAATGTTDLSIFRSSIVTSQGEGLAVSGSSSQPTSLRIVSSTIGDHDDIALLLDGEVDAVIRSSTIYDNGAGIVQIGGATAALSHSLLSKAATSDLVGPAFSSLGHNYISRPSPSFVATGTDHVDGDDPTLQEVMAGSYSISFNRLFGAPLLNGGAASIDDQDDSACTSADQAGAVRSVPCDIGAMEHSVIPPPPPPPPDDELLRDGFEFQDLP